MAEQDRMKFELDLKNERVADAALITDLQRVAAVLGRIHSDTTSTKHKANFHPTP